MVVARRAVALVAAFAARASFLFMAYSSLGAASGNCSHGLPSPSGGACGEEDDRDDLKLLQLRAPASGQTLYVESYTPKRCSVNDHVPCPGQPWNCFGKQCCTDPDGGPNFPCPSAPREWGECQTPVKKVDCLAGTTGATTAPTTPSCDSGRQEDGTWSWDLHTGLACLSQAKIPLDKAVQNIRAMASFFEDFYAFAFIAADPAATPYEPSFKDTDIGVYCQPNGGGAAPESCKVDLLGGLRKLADDIDAAGTHPAILDVFGPMTSLFNGLRDAHVTPWVAQEFTGFTGLLEVLSKSWVLLVDSRTHHAVQFKISNSKESVFVDGTAEVSFLVNNRKVRSISGKPPMEWLLHTFAEPSVWPLPYKAIGARINELAMRYCEWRLHTIGSLTDVTSKFIVEYDHGRESSWEFVISWHGSDGEKTWSATAASFLQKGQQFGEFAKSFREITKLSGNRVDLSTLATSRSLVESEAHQESSPQRVQEFMALNIQPLPTSGATIPQDHWLRYPGVDMRTNTTYGYFEVKLDKAREKYMLWKLTSFGVQGSYPLKPYCEQEGACFEDFWKRLTQTAHDEGIKRLLVDVVGNGGGFIDFAWAFVGAMHPELPSEEKCSLYSRPLTKVSKMANAIAKSDFTSFYTWIDSQAARFKDLKQNGALKIVVHNLELLFTHTLNLKVGDLTDSQWLHLQFEMAQMKILWKNNAFEVQVGVPVNEKEFSNLVQDVFSAYLVLKMNHHPLFEEGDTHYMRVKVLQRGDDEREFTARWEECAEDFSNTKNPFSKILFLSDGLCGSSCTTGTMTSYLIAKKNPKHREIKYVTFGGTGGAAHEAKQKLAGYSFPGGNVKDGSKVAKKTFAWALFLLMMTSLGGLDHEQKKVMDFLSALANEVPDWVDALPWFTQSQIFQKVLQQRNVPDEYLFIQTDFYLPQWYYGVTGDNASNWDLTELNRMHSDASQAFEKF